jgi:glycosyltransferase involved in cell wall biosynthesis
MACSVPLISTNAGGLSEINIDGKTGFMGNVGDIETMSQKAIYILSDEKRLKEFKKAAIEQARHFEKQHIIPMYEKLYCDVISAYKREKAVAAI